MLKFFHWVSIASLWSTIFVAVLATPKPMQSSSRQRRHSPSSSPYQLHPTDDYQPLLHSSHSSDRVLRQETTSHEPVNTVPRSTRRVQPLPAQTQVAPGDFATFFSTQDHGNPSSGHDKTEEVYQTDLGVEPYTSLPYQPHIVNQSEPSAHWTNSYWEQGQDLQYEGGEGENTQWVQHNYSEPKYAGINAEVAGTYYPQWQTASSLAYNGQHPAEYSAFPNYSLQYQYQQQHPAYSSTSAPNFQDPYEYAGHSTYSELETGDPSTTYDQRIVTFYDSITGREEENEDDLNDTDNVWTRLTNPQKTHIVNVIWSSGFIQRLALGTIKYKVRDALTARMLHQIKSLNPEKLKVVAALLESTEFKSGQAAAWAQFMPEEKRLEVVERVMKALKISKMYARQVLRGVATPNIAPLSPETAEEILSADDKTIRKLIKEIAPGAGKNTKFGKQVAELNQPKVRKRSKSKMAPTSSRPDGEKRY